MGLGPSSGLWLGSSWPPLADLGDGERRLAWGVSDRLDLAAILGSALLGCPAPGSRSSEWEYFDPT